MYYGNLSTHTKKDCDSKKGMTHLPSVRCWCVFAICQMSQIIQYGSEALIPFPVWLMLKRQKVMAMPVSFLPMFTWCYEHKPHMENDTNQTKCTVAPLCHFSSPCKAFTLHNVFSIRHCIQHLDCIRHVAVYRHGWNTIKDNRTWTATCLNPRSS